MFSILFGTVELSLLYFGFNSDVRSQNQTILRNEIQVGREQHLMSIHCLLCFTFCW